MVAQNITRNYMYFITPQQILFLHLKRDEKKIKQLDNFYFYFSTADNAIQFYNRDYGSSKFNTFLYEVTKDSIQIVDGNLNGTLNYWNRKLKESGSDMRYCTSAKNAVKYRNKLIERQNKKVVSDDHFQVQSKTTTNINNIITERIKYKSKSGNFSEDIKSTGVYYCVTNDLEIKKVKFSSSVSVVSFADRDIESKINWFDAKNNCWLRETKEEAIDDLISIISKKLKVALES
jgi:hypothetical protein